MSACSFSVPLCLGMHREHLAQRLDLLLDRVGLAVALLGGLVLRCQVRGHGGTILDGSGRA